MSKKYYLVILLASVVIAVGVILKAREKGPSSDCVSNSSPIFTNHITDLSKVEFIQPPGGSETWEGEPILKTHSYVVVKEEVPVYAPVDSELYEGVFYEEEGMTQYSLFFNVGCEVFYIFDHIQEPVEKIKQAFTEPPRKDSRTRLLKTPIVFKAGELIGYSTGTRSARHWDFGVYNKKHTNFLKDSDFPNLSERDLQATCPYDYFPEEKRLAYYALFGTIRTDQSVPTTFCKKQR